VGGLVVFGVFRVKRGVRDELLECLSLAHELDQLWVGRSALVDAVFVFSEEFIKSAATFLGQHLVDFSLGEAVSVSAISRLLWQKSLTWLRK